MSLKNGVFAELMDKRSKAIFLERKNRFVGVVKLQGEVLDVYVPNTGRCKELLFEGNEVLLMDHGNSHRKYRYSVSEAKKDDYYVAINSTIANKIIDDELKNGRLGLEGPLQKEVKCPLGSRLDFRVGNTFIEVKSVTLDEGGLALFPDAPTERGIRHLKELSGLKALGYDAWIIYVIFTRSHAFSPHPKREKYLKAFLEAIASGVKILPLLFIQEKGIYLNKGEIPLELKESI